jgi:tight adherence protein C
MASVAGPFLAIAWFAAATAVFLAVVYAKRAARVRSRLWDEHHANLGPMAPLPVASGSWLRRWLFVAGFRRPGSVATFLAAAVAAIVLGLGVAFFVRGSTELLTAREWLYDLPGGIGVMADPVLQSAPWFFAIFMAALPWLVVRAARRKRVREIEEDLPITLQLLATLARAGLGLDAAMIRVLDSSDPTRTLPQELMQFRRENLSGIPRSECWRHLSRRVDIPSISIFCSAMIHAEQVGGGISEVLEHQTEDVQSRRREQALIVAQALPVKLVFPLVICFLPGIFVWTLGPAFYQFLQLIDGVLRGASGGAGGAGP